MTLRELKERIDEVLAYTSTPDAQVMVDCQSLRLASWSEGEPESALCPDWQKYPHWHAGEFVADLELPDAWTMADGEG